MGERIANRLAVPAIVKLVKDVLQYVKATISLLALYPTS